MHKSEGEHKSYQELDAIALGIEAKLDPVFAYQKVVTQRTIETAQQIGISKVAIQRWEIERRKQTEERKQAIKAERDMLAKAKCS